MPWARAAATNTLKRAEPAAGISAGALPRPSRYSAITGLSNTATPSSSTRQGTLPSGLLACNAAGSSIGLQTTSSRSAIRSEEHTSELQSLMRISYAVFCLKKKTTDQAHQHTKFDIIRSRIQYKHEVLTLTDINVTHESRHALIQTTITT